MAPGSPLQSGWVETGRPADVLEATRRIAVISPYDTDALALVRSLEEHPSETPLAG